MIQVTSGGVLSQQIGQQLCHQYNLINCFTGNPPTHIANAARCPKGTHRVKLSIMGRAILVELHPPPPPHSRDLV